jgi:hypothetical protein
LGARLARERATLAIFLVSGLVGMPLWWTGLTLATSAGDYRTAGAVVRTGTARVGNCERVGPVSFDGFGYHWQCDTVVRWEDGRTERVTVLHGQLSPADTGRQVTVAERRSRGRGYSTDVVVPPFVTDSGRANTGHVLTFIGVIVAAPFLLLVGVLALLLAAVVALIALATVLWLVRLVTSPRSALASARRLLHRSPPDDTP